jgi:hypothetical protein
VPNHLIEFVTLQAPKWIDNSIIAKYFYAKDHHYLKEKDSHGFDRIVPVDFANTGVIQNSTSWGDGLH